MKRIKFLSIFFMIFIFSLSWSSQNFRGNKEKEPKNFPFRQEIRYIKSINEGQPFRYQGPPYAPDQVLVKFKASLSIQSIEAITKAYRLNKIKKISSIDVYKFQIPENISVEELLYSLNKNPDVEYAEPNYKVYLAATPNDILFRYQYNLYNSGQEVGPPGSPQGKKSADIKATQAWEETKGEKIVLIAVIDTGVDLLHPDINEKLYSSGRDYVNNDFDATDDHGHGTHVAGIVAAETNNQEGIAGVAWNCKILPVKVLDENGVGDVDLVIEGIDWAVTEGANVINMSFGANMNIKGLTPSRFFEEAIRDAYEKNVVLVAAAGNDNGPVLYPAAFDAYCLAVAASDYNDLRAEWSNFGPEIDVAAPGVWILSLWPESLTDEGYLPYVWTSGTSMATPHVAGLAALIKSIKPWLNVREIMDIIRFSADDINSSLYPGKDDYVGFGRISMEKALVPIKITSSK